ncbi:MAG: methyltransferase [Ponticaulis sp.]|nr:methyltransferase [Ponticaulis sp.]|tara:strand:+ start:8921 stop:9622 length:702 start_codon:yes stop_codon:yes gene_type:complete
MSAGEDENPFLKSFKDPQAVANYLSGPPLFVPGFEALHRMTNVLLAERVPETGRILVLGAGGGIELRAMASFARGWTFEGVDPAGEMLTLAEKTLDEHADRAALVEGYIDDASEGPFDGAVCLLTLHFLEKEERLRTLKEIHRRLKPGAPFIAAHTCLPEDADARTLWLDRYAAYALASGAPMEMVTKAREAVGKMACLYPGEVDMALMSEAGFSDADMFFAAITWRGWISYA